MAKIYNSCLEYLVWFETNQRVKKLGKPNKVWRLLETSMVTMVTQGFI